MIALKDNKVYTIDETQKKHYIAQGFDIQDDEGNTIAYGQGKTVPYEKYAAVVKELENIKASQGGNDEFSGLTVEELKAYAAEHSIDLGQATSQDGIIKKIRSAQKA